MSGAEPAYTFRIASDADRDAIYQLRHDVYATELRQYPEQSSGKLTDEVDAYNLYIAAWCDTDLVGFVSVTPPGEHPYAAEKYYPRTVWPFSATNVFETRVIAVRADHRGGHSLVAGLSYAAFRWSVRHGAERLITNAHRRMLAFYTLSGMTRTGLRARSGELDLELMTGTVDDIQRAIPRLTPMLHDISASARSELGFPLFDDQ